MMAGIENHDREQSRVEKVVIVHAEKEQKDLDETIRPLAAALERDLKLGEQAEYRRKFSEGTDIAECVLNLMQGDYFPEEHTRMVVVVSDNFVANCAKNQPAFQQIKNELFSRTANSKFALVCPGMMPKAFSGFRCINMDNFINNLEGGNLAEAIYRVWFGPLASLASQAELSMSHVPLTLEEYTPDKVKIIHAMTRPEARERYWGKISNAIEIVANLDNTTQARLHFRQKSVAQTVLDDVEGFKKCAQIMKKINAVVIWCPNMLASLNQDPAAKAKVIKILCLDTQPQKLFAHFLFGVDEKQMQRFSGEFWTFLSVHKHMAYIDASQMEAPNVDYYPFASIFLRSWAGSRRGLKSPEESADPTMTSWDEATISQTTSGSTQHRSDQFQPQQNQSKDHLVMNGASLDHDQANHTQQVVKALRSTDSSTKDRMLTVGESWDPGLVAVANRTRESQSDGSSNPPGNWSLRNDSMSQQDQVNGQVNNQANDRGQLQGLVQQPMPGSGGQNKMATVSMSSVSIDSECGRKRFDPQVAANRGAVSLPPGSSAQMLNGGIMVQPHLPVTSGASGVNVGQNRFAASGFQSHTIDSLRSNASAPGYGPASQMASVGERSAVESTVSGVCGSSEPSTRQGDSHLSLQQQNPVRLSSDDARQLDAEMSMCKSVAFPTMGNQSMPGQDRPSTLTNNRQSFPSYGHQSAPDQDTASVMSTSQSMPEMSAASSSDLPLVAEGTNPMTNGESSMPSAPTEPDQDQADPAPLTFPKPIMRGLELRLDPIKSAISDWRDLASHFKVPSEHITYWKGMMSAQGNCSPTENLIEWMKTEKKAVTVEDFKQGLRKIVRFDVLKFLGEKGY